MKKNLLFILALPILASCSKVFYQYATVASDELELKADGVYVDSDNNYEILYDFWDNSGVVRFVFHNTSESDIYIDLTRSFLIKNGLSYDYYQDRTWTNSSAVSAASSLSLTKGKSAYGSLTGSYIYQPSIIANLGLASSYSVGVSGSYSSTNSSGVSVKEKEGIWVPAHSSRVFSEFSIMSSPYRECGFDRYPKGDNTTKEFTYVNSPVIFTNRLFIKVNGIEKQITNNFYISSITNLSEKKATYRDYDKDLCGNKIGTDRKLYIKNASPNKFYNTYYEDIYNDLDKESKTESSGKTTIHGGRTF